MINQILKPKTNDDFSKMIEKMHVFEFVDKFNGHSLKGIKISFYKRMMFFILNKYMQKYHQYIYWPIWIGWVAFTFIKIPTLKLILGNCVYILIIIMLIVIFISNLKRRYIKKQNKNSHTQTLHDRTLQNFIAYLNQNDINRPPLNNTDSI